MPVTGTSASTQTVQRSNEPYWVSVEEYVSFHKQETLLVRGLVPREDVQELIDHMDNLLAGRETIPGIAVPSFRQSPQEKLQYCNARSLVPWNHGAPYESESANYLHILALDTTHLPMRSHASAHLVQRTSPKGQHHVRVGGKPMSMMGDDNGMMGLTPHAEKEHDDADT